MPEVVEEPDTDEEHSVARETSESGDVDDPVDSDPTFIPVDKSKDKDGIKYPLSPGRSPRSAITVAKTGNLGPARSDLMGHKMLRTSSDEISIASDIAVKKSTEIKAEEINTAETLVATSNISPEKVSKLASLSIGVVMLCLIALFAIGAWAVYGSSTVSSMSQELELQLEKIDLIGTLLS